MTREEAIEIISNIDKAWRNFTKEEYIALEMAISALSEDKTQMIDKSNFDTDQYKADLQCAYDCGYSKALSKNRGEWIPVSERLPEEKKAVLVWCPEYKNIYCAYCANGNWWIFGVLSQIIPNAVIAWQPLPEPYKAESEDKE